MGGSVDGTSGRSVAGSRSAFRLRALIGASHPIPSVTVTLVMLGLFAAADNERWTIVRGVLAVLSGQLAIGWSNDRLDIDLDTAAKRSAKPATSGAVSTALLDRAIVLALVACIAWSASLGWRAAVAHLVGVAAGLLYNRWLKATVLSWLPYAIAFGLLPAVATLARSDHPMAAPWAVLAGGALGVAAHFANVLPDMASDVSYGVRGLPHRVGHRWSVVITLVAVCLASAAIVFGPPGSPDTVAWVGVGLVAALSTAGLFTSGRDEAGRGAFFGVIAIVGIDLVVVLVSAPRAY